MLKDLKTAIEESLADSAKGTPTVELGEGKVGVCSMYVPAEDKVGLAFVEMDRAEDIEAECFLKITATSAAALDTLISVAQEAKDMLKRHV